MSEAYRRSDKNLAVTPTLLENTLFIQAALYRFRLGEALGEKAPSAGMIVSEIAHDLEIRLTSRSEARLVSRVARMLSGG